MANSFNFTFADRLTAIHPDADLCVAYVDRESKSMNVN